MAARRGKSQARRNSGNGGVPGWAWGIAGVVVGIVLILAAPQLLKSDGDSFFRPQPNPDAQPAPVAAGGDEVVAPAPVAQQPAARDDEARDNSEYDFYTLLPGKEVPLSDAELAATQRAETQRQRAQDQDPDAAAPALPRPVTIDDAAPRRTAGSAAQTPDRTRVAGDDDRARYLLQAGAFQASGQAEELKARIALLGLSARVESALIDGDTVYRVRMGPYGTASELADAKRKLESGGLPALAVRMR